MSSSATRILLQFLLVTTILLLGCDALDAHPKCHLVTSQNKRKPTTEVNVVVGSDVYIDCINSASHTNQSDPLFWSFNSSRVKSHLTEQVSPNVLSLHLKNASVDQSGFYKCSNLSTGLCLTEIKIGYKPLPVLNFNCFAYNLEYMECSWTSPYNPVTVSYAFSVVYSRMDNLETNRLKATKNRITNTYYFNITSELRPPYDLSRQTYIFNLYGTNRLGNVTWPFTIKHYEHVIPGKVTNLQANPLPNDLRTYKITYEKSHMMKYFDPGLTYRIEYISPWMDSKMVIERSDTWALIPVLPYTEYAVNVSCLSKLANNSLDYMWSKPTSVKFQTSPEAPGAPPVIVTGSFQAKSFINYSDITLYWQSIPDILKNGANISYIVIAKSLNSDMETALSTKQAYATFTNLNHSDGYSFLLYTQNDNGTSINSSEITVGAMKSLLPKPKSITVIAYSSIHYTVSWLPPSKSVAGYRIFWMESNSTFSINEEGVFYWTDVGSLVTSVNITVAGKLPYYNFGVTSIDGDNASGIIWNTCIVRSNGVVGKMKTVSVNVPCSNSLNVQWNIDCAEKIGIITEYRVYYCPAKAENDSCITGEPVRNTSQHDINAYSVTLQNLTPNKWYRITVSVVTKAGEGEHSDAVFARTLESKPEPVSDMEVLDVTNSSFVVKWHPPSTTNGNITHYNVNYATSTETYTVTSFLNTTDFNGTGITFIKLIHKNVKPFTKYNVSVMGCTSAGCSLPSIPKSFVTEIGVPDQMSPPRVRLVNMTYAVISPETNGEINGPSLTWDIKTVIITSDNHTKEAFYSNLTEEMKYIRVDCDSPELNGALMEWQTRAINIKKTELLVGNWSDYTKIGCLEPTFPVGLIIAIVVASAVGLTIMIFFAIGIAKQVKDVAKKVNIQLPPKLKDIEEYNDYCDKKSLRNNDYIKTDLKNGARKKLLDDDYSRSRNISGDTTQSSGSTEELLMQSKGQRLHYGNDSIGSGNHDSISSRPSTTQTQLSSESSLESVPSVPESPDSVFNEHPLNGVTAVQNVGMSVTNVANNSGNNVFNPTLTPIGETQDGNSSHSGTPQHYSKFAGYYGSVNNSPSPKRGGRVVHNGYVTAPYSKLASSNVGESSNLGGPHADSLGSPFALEIDDDPSLTSYSKFGLSIPLFTDQQQPSDAFQKGIAATSSPLTITPVHSVTGYSVLGLGRTNATPETNSAPFSQPPPAAVSSPIEGGSKGYVLPASIINFTAPSYGETSDISKQEDCGTSIPPQSLSSTIVEGHESPNYTSMNAHKRSPSSASSLAAGYCRLALSRPTSLCSETDPNYVQTESQTGSPVMTSCNNNAFDMVQGAGSPSHTAGSSNIMCNPENSVPVPAMTVVGKSGVNGYATMQQLLKEKGNS
ncbi:hypothetical protein CHUAL_004741 [Chamberlinius hualienensis]